MRRDVTTERTTTPLSARIPQEMMLEIDRMVGKINQHRLPRLRTAITVDRSAVVREALAAGLAVLEDEWRHQVIQDAGPSPTSPPEAPPGDQTKEE
jgi:hypothetical protein